MDEITKPSDEELANLFADPQRPRWKLSAGAAVVLGLIACAVVVLMLALQPRSAIGVPAEMGTPTPTPTTAAELPVDVPTSGTLVHILGAVASPGVYELGANARVVDAIAAAGGLNEDADVAQINLARPAVDGEQIYVPKIGETPPPLAEVAPEPGANGGHDANGDPNAGGTTSAGGLVNINTASVSELENLPRIGPAMAQRIIDYRDANGGFSSVDELKEVSGIGEATFEQLAPLVTV
ncbi:MAG: helix-hairpin-helix domain-containing protein [Gulosibacter sp.]|uniref:helix-hairpin-helix domain-containing protein n=1 Tax=Gulosibacter sp. TaxID=2817531 RepID=UPI003F92D8EA